MGLVKRRLFKPERRAARKKGVIGTIAPVDCPDASQPEVVSAIAHICGESEIRVGRGGEYDQIKDEYTVIAKVLDGSYLEGKWTGKVRDAKIKGFQVAQAILYTRALALGRFDLLGDIAKGRLWQARFEMGGLRYDRPMTWAV